MKGLRCLSFAALFAVSLTALFIVFSGSVKAGANYDNCDVMPTYSYWHENATVSPVKAALFNAGSGLGAQNGQVWISTKPIRLLKHTNSMYYLAVKKDSDPVSSVVSYSAQIQNANKDIPHYPVYNTPTTPSSVSGQDTTEWWWPVGNNTSYSFPCKTYGQVTYHASWDQDQSPGTETIPNPVENCDALNFACWINSAWDTATQQILQGITFLFVPNKDSLGSTLTSFRTFMETKLGFLVYPFTFIVDTLGALQTSVNAAPNSCAPFRNDTAVSETYGMAWTDSDFFGSSTSEFMGNINLCSIGTNLTNMIRIIFQVSVAFVLLKTFQHKLQEIKSQ